MKPNNCSCDKEPEMKIIFGNEKSYFIHCDTCRVRATGTIEEDVINMWNNLTFSMKSQKKGREKEEATLVKVPLLMKSFLYLLCMDLPPKIIETLVEEAKNSNHTVFRIKHMDEFVVNLYLKLMEE